MTSFIDIVAAYTGLSPLMVWLSLFLCTLAIAIRLTVDAFFTFREWWAKRRAYSPTPEIRADVPEAPKGGAA